MNRISTVTIIGAVVMMSLLAACSLPVSSTPTQISFPTPDQAQTLTAVFHIPPTGTSIPQATQAQTATSAVTGTRTTGTATSLTATITPTAANCTNLAKFVSETIPDYSFETPGSSFIKTWTLQNVGTCTWGTGYSLAFDHGDQMGGAASVPITTTVAPNATITVSVPLTAPTTPANYQGFWKLASPQNVKFGLGATGSEPFWVLVTTNASSATAAYAPAYTAVPVCVAKTTRPSANGSMVEAYMAGGTPPTINADLTDWSDPLLNIIDKHVFTKSGLSKGSDTATFTLKWDQDYLYVAIHVLDGDFIQKTSGGSKMYNGDSLEILLDTDLEGDYCNNFLDSDDFQLGLNPGDLTNAYSASSPAMYLWYPKGKTGSVLLGATASQISSITVSGGWIVEARISWGVFGLAPQTILERKFGFAFSVSDNDNYSAGSDGEQQRMISNDPNRVLSDPTTWGTMELDNHTGP
jgi:hypothetical protein